MKMNYWEARTRVKQLLKYYDEKNKAAESSMNKSKSSSSGRSRSIPTTPRVK